VLPSAQESLGQIVGTTKRLEQAIPKMEKAADEFAALSRSGREFVPELRQTNSRVQDLLGQPDPAEQANIRALLKELVELMKKNGPELNRTLVAVRQAAENTNEVLNAENRKAFAASLKNIQAGSDDLTKTIRLIALLSDQADRTLKVLTARLEQSEKAIENLNRITTPLAANADQISKDLAEMTKNLNAIAGQLGGGQQGGSLGKVLTDPALYQNLSESAANAARLLARMERVAQDLQVFSDKIARKPEVLGAGGVVRPSSGLKESPTAPLPPSSPLPIAPTAGGPVAPPTVTPIPPVSSYKPANDLPPPRRDNP
jgi:ABC-type transporter Mla subunit MlaD